MLKRLHVRGFKSLASVEIEFPALTVLFGPNAAGKSNLLDALLVLSRMTTERTLTDALSGPVRGYPAELFQFPSGGLAALHEQDRVRFTLEADLLIKVKDRLRYRVAVETQPRSGSLSVADEYLTRLSRSWAPSWTPALQVVDNEIGSDPLIS